MGKAKRRKAAGTFGVNAENVIRTLIIPRDIIENGVLGIRDTIQNVERLFVEGRRNQVLMVDGYNDDPRSLCDIPEVCNHLLEVTRHSPIAFVVSPSSMLFLFGIKENRCHEPWFSNSVNHTHDFIRSQIDWISEHYPVTDEDNENFSFVDPDWEKLSANCAVKYHAANLFGAKIKYIKSIYMSDIDMSDEVSADQADASWRKHHPDVE